jgi:hypothetical protein
VADEVVTEVALKPDGVPQVVPIAVVVNKVDAEKLPVLVPHTACTCTSYWVEAANAERATPVVVDEVELHAAPEPAILY